MEKTFSKTTFDYIFTHQEPVNIVKDAVDG